ncbi:MAG: 30S ribosomal protein S3 [Candidatus Latescibacteria bacterium]|nr:30S ribosomal protein S3 [Candidatus Latescibacterota bacterium]NIM20820.1 30S ribosomal protein S3 [Candidatus Latescibacterota bacterium]NIM64386.1 30S ribosomal protein S3 [Candidatus Latescibacterota bacterium]NIO00537.1 30S ribosomal protein S3 [Candidatus Latescibacterota bacterium]NIO26940.1 30S ribosomal protein S3 [Candidatus Latescibacterota bacterium]
MGQKTNPIGLRIGINRTWDSRWFSSKDYAKWLSEDIRIRKYVKSRLYKAGVAKIEIERSSGKATVNIFTARPGMVIGRKGAEVDMLRDELKHLSGKEIQINIKDVKKPELNAQLVAEHIAMQLEQRVSFRRAMKKTIASAMRMGAQGIKVQCAGRLGGAEMARREGYHEGRVPLHTLRADIDFARATAHTTFGCVGVKVWIYKGEIYPKEFKRSLAKAGEGAR